MRICFDVEMKTVFKIDAEKKFGKIVVYKSALRQQHLFFKDKLYDNQTNFNLVPCGFSRLCV
jgi:hypothetical protein